jgi:hypothetical protein
MDLGLAARRLRQHHAIEHATVTLLSQRLPGAQIVARSDLDGYVLYGEVETSAVRAAAQEAIARLQQGERTLAVHPHCGTNLVAAAVLTGTAALLAGSGQRRSLWWERLPSAILAALVALFIAAPVGQWLQVAITTTPEVAGLRIRAIERLPRSPVAAHRVTIAPAERET